MLHLKWSILGNRQYTYEKLHRQTDETLNFKLILLAFLLFIGYYNFFAFSN